MRRLGPLLATIVGALAVTASSPADVPSQQAAAAAYGTATQLVWGAVPCGGIVSIGADPTLPEGVYGTAHWNMDSTGRPGGFTNCVIRWAIWPAWDWETFCQVVSHEVGHLLLGGTYYASTNPQDPSHSPDPASVMYAVVTSLNVPKACAPRRKPAKRHHHTRRRRK